MGLSATSARIFLLTKENNSYELAAQDVSEERMILAKEQEEIANEYSDATSNMVYQCRVVEDGETQNQTMSLDSLAKSQSAGVDTANGNAVVIADATGKPMVAARYEPPSDTATKGKVTYSVNVGGFMVDFNYDPLSEKGSFAQDSPTDAAYAGPKFSKDDQTSELAKKYTQIIGQLNTNAQNSILQNGIENNSLQLWVQAPDAEANGKTLSQIVTTSNVFKKNDGTEQVKTENDFFTRKSPDSLSGTSSRYYTEDDAAAQAHYQSEMTRTSALDTKLENKLNHIETQKKACEKELESAESIKSSNVDRTFSYFQN